MEKQNVEMQIADALFHAYALMFTGEMDAEERQILVDGIKHVDINDATVAQVLAGILVANKAIYDMLLGTDAELSEVAGAFATLAASIRKGDGNGA